jgi:hypothetical protein
VILVTPEKNLLRPRHFDEVIAGGLCGILHRGVLPPSGPSVGIPDLESRQRPKSVSGDSGAGDETSALPVMDSQRQVLMGTPGRLACAPNEDARTSSKPATPLADIRRFVLIASM